MKLLSKLSIIAGAAALATPMLTAQTTEVATIPVGVVEKSFPAGNSVVASLFVNANEFQGSSSSMSESSGNTTILFGSDVFSAGAYDEGAYPAYYAEVVSGSNEGFAYDIISNTANSITIAGLAKTDNGLSDVETIAIRKHVTVGQFFESAEGLTAFVDSLKFFGVGTQSSSYLWDGTKFVDGTNTDVSDKQIYPGSGFILSTLSGVTITYTGTVKSTATRIPVFAEIGTINLISSTSPVNEILGSMDLATQMSPFVDSIKFLEDGSLAEDGVYVSDGTSMLGGSGNADDVTVASAESFILAIGSDQYILIPSPYTAD